MDHILNGSAPRNKLQEIEEYDNGAFVRGLVIGVLATLTAAALFINGLITLFDK